MEISGKVVLITGASAGIGLATARAIAREGAHVALAARSENALAAETERLTHAGYSVAAVRMDVTSDASVRAAVDAILVRWGRVDVLVNNAGNGGTLALWAATDPEHTRRMFDVHVFGMERASRAVLPSMIAQGAGTIVNVASTVAWVPMPAAVAYSAAKAAVVAFSNALRAELAESGVDVLLFAPPHTSTDAGRAWPLEGPVVFSPEEVATEFIRALRGGKRQFLAGASNRALLVLQRLSPAYASYIMRRIGLRAHARVMSAR